MKRILLAVAVVVMAAVTAHAQSAMLVANVPFDFHAGAVQMKAGEYRVSQPGVASAIRIHKPSGSPSVFLLTNAKSAGNSSDCKLVFHRYGNEYFLAEVWPGYTAQVKTIRKSRREREIAQTIGRPVEHVLYARSVPQR